MKTKLILTGALALFVNLSYAGPRTPFGSGELPEAAKPFDVDGDGKLSAEERQAFAEAMKQQRLADLLAEFDTDGDGKLSAEELRAAREARRARLEARRSDRFDELDTDDDGFLTATEFAPPGVDPTRLQTLFDRIDSDDDGKISKEEFLAVCRGPRGGGAQPPPSGGIR
jgi:Ca2+-binding EF-hand superfamily protein